MWKRFPEEHKRGLEPFVPCRRSQRRQNSSLLGLRTGLGDHDVVVVAIPDPQDVGGHAVAAAGVQEPLHGLLELQRQTPSGGTEAPSHTPETVYFLEPSRLPVAGMAWRQEVAASFLSGCLLLPVKGCNSVKTTAASQHAAVDPC